jgi:phosphoglycolate phosphatase-like HAD superfamily hydrolase
MDRPLAVFDIDGVLADVRHRLHHIDGRRKDWLAFFAAAVSDPVLPEGAALAAEAARDCDLLYLTGRPERCRRDTVSWLAQHGLPEGPVEMRPEHDRRPAAQLKPRVLARAAAGRTVAVVVDDDPLVCDAYENAGWPVLRATWADRSPVLEQAQEAEGRT